jgi:hypothetical protein
MLQYGSNTEHGHNVGYAPLISAPPARYALPEDEYSPEKPIFMAVYVKRQLHGNGIY